MAKIIVPNQGTQFDPLVGTETQLAELGISPVRTTPDRFSTQVQEDRLNNFSNLNMEELEAQSLYSNDPQAQAILEERRAQNQGATEQLFKGLGHMLSTAGTEVLKIPGYVGGAIGATASEIANPANNSMDILVNNAWVNAFESLDEGLKEMMPVYLTKDVQEGNIGRKLKSSAWWATTGADGIGFLLSMYAPGQFLKALNVGADVARAAQAVAKEGKLAKVFTGAGILEKTQAGALATDKAIANANSFTAVAANTFIESAAEAANTFDNAKKDFLSRNPNATEEEANAHAGTVAANVMKANMALLPISNMLDEIFLFKGFDGAAKRMAEKSMLGKLMTNGVFDISKVKKLGVKDALKQGIPKLVGNFAKEGLFEEGLQTEVQKHYEDVGSGKTNLSFMEDVVYNYFDDLATDPEMQESVVLGGILGGGASLFGIAGDIKAKNQLMFGRGAKTPSFFGKLFGQQETTAVKGLAETMSQNFVNSFRTIQDIAERNDDGTVKTEDGKIVIDEGKLTEMMEQKDKMVTLNQLHNIALLEGNQAEADAYGDLLSFNYFLPFLQQENGYEALKEHINAQVVNSMAAKLEATGQTVSEEDKAKIKTKLLKRAEEFNMVYREVDSTTNPEVYVRNDDPQKYGAWKQQLRDRKMQALISYNSAQRNLTAFNGLVKADIPSALLADFELDRLTPEQQEALSPVDQVKYKIYQSRKAELTAMAKAAKDEYVELTTKEGLKKSYAEFKQKKEELEKKTEETVAAEVQQTAKDIESAITQQDFIQSVVDNGEDVFRNPDIGGFYIRGETVLLEDKNGKRYLMQSVYNPAAKRVDQILTGTDGKSETVTDATGQLKPQFLSRGMTPISKQRLALEGKAIRLKERKQAQIALIDEILSHRTNEIDNSKKEIERIESDLESFNTKLDELKTQLDAFYQERLAGKAKPRKQVKLEYERMKQTLADVEQTITNLRNRRLYLETRIPKLQALVSEYQAFKDEVVDKEAISLEVEKKKAGDRLYEAIANLQRDTVLEMDILAVQEMIDKSIELIGQMDEKLVKLVALRYALRKVIASHGAFYRFLATNERQRLEAIDKLTTAFAKHGPPYAFDRIFDIITKEPHEVVAGETLVKNNIVTNAEEIAQSMGITPEEVFEQIQEIIKPFALSEADTIEQYGLTPQEAYELRDKVYATNKEINELRQTISAVQAEITLQQLNKRYLILDELNRDKVVNRFNQIKSEQELRNVDKSQKQTRFTDAEPNGETQLRQHFLQHALPTTPFSTTGKNVLYTQDGTQKGKDLIDDNGFPTLNDNVFQRTWFMMVDKLANEIADYRLLPIHARYDGSDEFQKIIEANTPDESLRGPRDVLVFLVDSNGKPVMVDPQGNRLSSGGTHVFTSIRKAEEVFPHGEMPRVVPDMVLNSYIRSLGLPENKIWERVKEKTIGETITSKKGRELFKDILNEPMTVLMDRATEHARAEYEAFVDQLINAKNQVLPIESVTRGYPLYQIVDGKRKMSNPLMVFEQLSLEKGKYGPDQLNGGKMGTIIDQQIKVRGRFINLPAGSLYLQFPNDDFVTLNSRTINEGEVQTVMYLLAMANGVNNLNTISVPFPKKKDGSSYYYFLNNKRIENTLPVFYRKSADGVENFSLLHSLINYGSKPNQQKNGEIYIQSGNVIFQTFDNKRHSIPLSAVAEAIKSDNFKADAVAPLYEFLLTKRFNVNRVLLGNNPRFLYPQLKKRGKGDYELRFDTGKTYYEFLFDGTVTTSATKKEGYPQFLQRNIVYRPELVPLSQPTKKTEEIKPPTEIPGVKTIGIPPVSAKQAWLKQRVINAKKVIDANPPMQEVLREGNEGQISQLMAKFQAPMEKAAKEANQTFTEADMVYLAASLRAHVNPAAPTPPTPVVEARLEAVPTVVDRPDIDIFAPTPPANPKSLAERLAEKKGVVNLKPAASKKADDVDKRIDPQTLLNQLMKNKEIKRECR